MVRPPSARRRASALRALLAALLIVVVPGAPLARVGRTVCDVCPPSCPMHAKPGVRPQRGCHRAVMRGAARPALRASTRPAHDPRHCARDAGFRRPGCRAHGQLPTAVIADALLPPRLSTAPCALVRCTPTFRFSSPARGDDPPEQPPPIVLS